MPYGRSSYAVMKTARFSAQLAPTYLRKMMAQVLRYRISSFQNHHDRWFVVAPLFDFSSYAVGSGNIAGDDLGLIPLRRELFTDF